jgi:hypothetical protein
MSSITIHVYDGDPEAYNDHDEPGTIGQRDPEREKYYTDGEELSAAVAIVALLRDGKHFDVRLWVN